MVENGRRFVRYLIPVGLALVILGVLFWAIWDLLQGTASGTSIDLCYPVKGGTLTVRSPSSPCETGQQALVVESAHKEQPINPSIFPLALSAIAGVTTIYLAVDKIRKDEETGVLKFLSDSWAAAGALQRAIDAVKDAATVTVGDAERVRAGAEAVQQLYLPQQWSDREFYAPFSALQQELSKLQTALGAFKTEMQPQRLQQAMGETRSWTQKYIETAPRAHRP